MNFFEQQVRARRASRWLLLLFVAAVLSLLALTQIATLLVLSFFSDGPQPSNQPINQTINWFFQHVGSWQIYVSLGLLSLMALAITYKWQQLQPGGRVIAAALGCRPILPQTASVQEKQLINVVEEMALASGLPVPAVYSLPSASINAFAAGFTSADAVIGVTTGALTHLTRDELQAVIAHEFSHMVNGDMRLNAQLLALLFGIECIGHAGRMLSNMDTGYFCSRSRSAMAAFVLALVFLVIGYLGSLFAKMIKAAINRQREYLADAAAVQFTRYADGLANALLKVGAQGSDIDHPQARVMSHFFFGNAESALFSGHPLATHPTIDQRLSKIKPQWTQGLLKFKTRGSRQPATAGAADANITAFATVSTQSSAQSSIQPAAQSSTQSSTQPAAQQAVPPATPSIFDEWRKRVHEPYEACLLVYALAFAQQHEKAQQRCRLLLQIQYAAVQSLHHQLVLLSENQRWQLLSMAMPSLKALSKAQYLSFKKTLRALIQIDHRIDLYEWSLFEWVTHVGDAQFVPRAIPQPQYQHIEDLLDEYVYVLKLLIQHLHADADLAEQGGIFLNALHAIGVRQTSVQQTSVQQTGAQQPISWQPAQWHWQTFHAAQKKLAQAYPLLKARLIKGWLHAARPASQLNAQPSQAQHPILLTHLAPSAQHLLTALAACLDVPFLLMTDADQ